MEVQSRVGSPNRTKPNRTEPYRTLGEPNRDHVRFLANTNRDEQSLPMFGSFGCSVRQDTNRTEQMCLMFVFGSCSVRLVRYNVVPRIFRTVGSPAGQPYAFISGSLTAPWELIIHITKIPVNFAVSGHFIQCGEYLITYSKLAEPNEHEPYKGHVRFGSCSNRTEQTFVVRLKNRTRTVQGACSVRFAYSNTNRDEQALRCSVRFGSVRRAHSDRIETTSFITLNPPRQTKPSLLLGKPSADPRLPH